MYASFLLSKEGQSFHELAQIQMVLWHSCPLPLGHNLVSVCEAFATGLHRKNKWFTIICKSTCSPKTQQHIAVKLVLKNHSLSKLHFHQRNTSLY